MKSIAARIGESYQSIYREIATWDQGNEIHHQRVEQHTGLKIYFCYPRSPWQRGSNENVNGLLRQYFLKGTHLAVLDGLG